jgi:hypothetical protein
VRFEVIWSPPPGDEGIPPRSEHLTFGASLPVGVSASFSPASVSLGAAGGSKSCTVTISASASAPQTNGPSDSTIQMTIGNSAFDTGIQLTVGAPVAVKSISSLFSGVITVSFADPNPIIPGLPIQAEFNTSSWQFLFTQQLGQQGPSPTYLVEVSRSDALRFDLLGNAVTLTPGPEVVGSYNSLTGQMDLNLPLQLTDNNGNVGTVSNPQSVAIDFSTSNAITSANTGMNATGSPLVSLGAAASDGARVMTLVGEGTCQATFLFVRLTVPFGLQFNGQFAPPFPPCPDKFG